MSKENTLILGEIEVTFNKAKWSKLPSLPARLALDLYQASCLADTVPAQLPGWDAWWKEAKDPWGKLFLAKEVRHLDQHHRAMAETGLGLKLARRKMHEAPLTDKGILARVAGMQWEEGLRDALARLPVKENPAQSRLLLAAALSHAIDLKRPVSSRILVEFAHHHAMSLDGMLPVPQLAKMWTAWSKSEKLSPEHPVYGQSLLVLPVLAGSAEEVEVWNAWCSAETFQRTHEAIAAWCRIMPEAWDRLHARSLQGEGVRCAWIHACRRADEFGLSDHLWQEAIRSPSAPQWMTHLWPKQRSPLVAWMSDLMDRKHGKNMPGSDKVSAALIQMGAPLPGSPEDRELGGKSLIECVQAWEILPKWTQANPGWILPNPRTGQTPLFEVENWSRAQKYVELGLEWQHADHDGLTAWNAFLGNFSEGGRAKKEFCRAAMELLAKGKLPLIDKAPASTIAGGMAASSDETLFNAYLLARHDAGLLPLPVETQDAAHRGKDLLPAWKQFWVDRKAWSDPHEHAMWRGLLARGYTKDLPLPASEDPNDPLWAWALVNSDYDLSTRLGTIASWGLQAMSGAHPVWENPKAASAWLDAVIDTRANSTSIDALKVNATPQWWADRLAQCRALDEGVELDPLIEKLCRLGLPLDEPEVGEALLDFPEDRIAGVSGEIASAIQSHLMSRHTTASVGMTTRRHRL